MKRLLTTAEAADLLNISEYTLERDRWAGARIPYIKIGRSVRYDPDEIERYLKSQVRRSTSDTGHASI
jgi:excisionase family DNA binding protein